MITYYLFMALKVFILGAIVRTLVTIFEALIEIFIIDEAVDNFPGYNVYEGRHGKNYIYHGYSSRMGLIVGMICKNKWEILRCAIGTGVLIPLIESIMR